MNGYIAGFQGKTVEIYADSLYQAKLKALAIFKPKKKYEGLVWVMLAEVNGKQVVHSTAGL